MALLLAAILAASPAQEPSANPLCPVMTGEATSPRHRLFHEGRMVYFCCENCVARFRAAPERYLDRLPPAPGRRLVHAPWLVPLLLGGVGAALLLRPGTVRLWGAALAGASAMAGAQTWAASLVMIVEGPEGINAATPAGWRIYGVSVGLGLLLAVGLRREGRLRALLRAAARRPWVWAPAGAALALGSSLGWAAFREHVREEHLDIIHFDTFRQFGLPPRPRPPAPPSLGGTFYRGNDERARSLFNGGNYLTCTFRLELRDGSGGVAAPGAALPQGPLAIRLEIERAPGTHAELFSESLMDRMFLTRESDPFMGARRPVPDRAGVATLEPSWKWEGSYLLGPPPAAGRLAGTVYVCEEIRLSRWRYYFGVDDFADGEEFEHRKVAGARMHYGIEYDLRFEDGRLAEASRLWMGSLYRRRDLPLPAEEWFSAEPMPVRPAGPKEDDDR